ncbi:flagellar basal body P-ring formation chaperone FlgA [Vibrio rumoiensis]|uniref:flagellar basal body P-ring formation chaperone FlgA n=1 Tax=Vibrio rumoiensis TaxID=76258 RepID=UPI003AA8E581
MRLKAFIVIALACNTLSLPANAGSKLNEGDVKAFVSEKIQAQLLNSYSHIRNIDMKIRVASSASKLPSCQSAMHVEDSDKIPLGNVRWKVVCDGVWSLTVMSATSAEVYAAKSTQKLKRGTRLVGEDIEMGWINLSYPNDVFQQAKSLVGLKLIRTMRKGDEFSSQHVALDYDALKGQEVSITYQASTFKIQTQGILLSDAQLGDKVSVENKTSGKEMIGTLTGKGTVQIF